MSTLTKLLRLWGVLFGGMALVLLLIPAHVVAVLNQVGTLLGWTTALALPNARFYSVLGVSLLVVLIGIARYAAADLPNRLPLVRLFILSKCISGAAYWLAMWQDQPAFAYLAAGLVDSGIGAITWLALWNTSRRLTTND